MTFANYTHILPETTFAVSNGKAVFCYSPEHPYLPLYAVYSLDSEGLPDGDKPALYEGENITDAMQAFVA